MYCSDSCRDFIKYFSALERALQNIQFTHDASKTVRGDLFSLSNQIFHEHTN